MRNKYAGADLVGRLHGTVVRYKGIALYCQVDGGDLVLRTLTNDRMYARITPDDPELDISSLPLGFVNFSARQFAVHIRRDPVRRYKQCVDPQAMTYTSLSSRHHAAGEVFKDPGFQENISNTFPNFKQALTQVSKTWESIALSRDVALFRQANVVKVHIGTDEVGFIRLQSGSDNNKCTIRKSDVSFIIRSKLGNLGIVVEEGL